MTKKEITLHDSSSVANRPTPVSWTQYESGWIAYQDDPTVRAVSRAARIDSHIAVKLIDDGFPSAGMLAYGQRLAKIRESMTRMEDYGISKAMAEDSRILRGLKSRVIDAFGPNFENLNISKESIASMTPTQLVKLVEGLDKLFRLEAFTLREGKDEANVTVSTAENATSTQAASKLSALLNDIEYVVKERIAKPAVIDVEPIIPDEPAPLLLEESFDPIKDFSPALEEQSGELSNSATLSEKINT